MYSWFRGYSLFAILLVGWLWGGLSLASVASAQVAAPAADAAAAGDAAAPAVAEEPAAEAAATAPAQAKSQAPAQATVAEVNYALVNTILLISAVLVIFMQAGFALVEVGLNSSKNAVNILAKNLLDFGMCDLVLRRWLWVDVSRVFSRRS